MGPRNDLTVLALVDSGLPHEERLDLLRLRGPAPLGYRRQAQRRHETLVLQLFSPPAVLLRVTQLQDVRDLLEPLLDTFEPLLVGIGFSLHFLRKIEDGPDANEARLQLDTNENDSHTAQ